MDVYVYEADIVIHYIMGDFQTMPALRMKS